MKEAPAIPRLIVQAAGVSVSEDLAALRGAGKDEQKAEAVRLLSNHMVCNAAAACVTCPYKSIRLSDEHGVRGRSINVVLHCAAKGRANCPDGWDVSRGGWVETTTDVSSNSLWVRPGEMLTESTVMTEITNTPKSGASHKSVRELQMDIQTSLHDARAEGDIEAMKKLRADPVHRAKEDFESWAIGEMTIKEVRWPEGKEFVAAKLATTNQEMFRREYMADFNAQPPVVSNDVPATTIGETW